MNLPSAKFIVDAEPLDIHELPKWEKKVPNGYIAVAGEGYSGIEESVFLLSEGKIIAISYEHLKYAYTLDGENAWKHVLNMLALKDLVFSVAEIPPAKLKIVIVFNEAAKVKETTFEQVLKKVPKEYYPELVKGIVRALPASELERIKTLAKYGLTDVKVVP